MHRKKHFFPPLRHRSISFLIQFLLCLDDGCNHCNYTSEHNVALQEDPGVFYEGPEHSHFTSSPFGPESSLFWKIRPQRSWLPDLGTCHYKSEGTDGCRVTRHALSPSGDVKSHGKLNLLDACLLKATSSSLCSLIPARDNFDLTGIFVTGTSLGVTATAISPLFLSAQPSSPLKTEPHSQLAQLFGSLQVFSPIVLLFIYSLLMPELCTSRWGCAPGPFPNASLSPGGDPAPQTQANAALFVSPRAILRTLMIRIIVGLIGSEAFTSISSKVMPMIDRSTIARSNWFHLEKTQNEV